MSIEIWKQIGTSQYEVSSLGGVRCLNRRNSAGHKLKDKVFSLNPNCGYYHRLALTCGRFYVHQLVAQAFLPNLENKPQVNHINGIKSDNRVENLEWATASENAQHAQDTGLQKANGWQLNRGIKHPKAILTEAQVSQIRRLGIEGLTCMQIAAQMGTTRNAVYAIVTGRTWKHVA